MKLSRFEINTKNKQSLRSFFDGKTLIAKRQHWLVLVPPVLLTPLVGGFFIVGMYILSIWLLGDILLFFLSVLTLIFLTSTVILKTVIHWYFHLYVVTRHKLLEINYNPFFAEETNEILLDLVRCTEIDIHTDGIINQLFNKGDVYVTFDRPTHEEGFVMRDISDPRDTSLLLSEILTPNSAQKISEKKNTWVKKKDPDTNYIYIEELLQQK